eukprot:Gb_15139 [translate_table: standard]
MIESLNEEHPEVVESDQEELVGAKEEIINIEDQEQQETPTISLVVMLISDFESKKQGQGKNNGGTCRFRRTHNFIESKLVSSVELRVEPLQNFQVAIANDTMMNCRGMVRGLKLQLDNYE